MERRKIERGVKKKKEGKGQSRKIYKLKFIYSWRGNKEFLKNFVCTKS